MRYPPTRTVDQVDDYHGRFVADPYRWLEDTDSDETRAWINAQNEVTGSWLSAVPERDRLRQRLEELWDRPRSGTPWRRGDRWFQLRNTGLQNQDVLWTMDAPDHHGRVLLDPNTLSDDGTVALSGTAVSHDGRLLAYATSRAGSDWLTWRIRVVATGQDLPDVVDWSKFSPAAWTHDGAGFYYARYDEPSAGEAFDETNRNQRLHYHRLGDAQADDRCVHERPDRPDWGFSPQVTDDGRWLVVTVWEGTDPRNRVYVGDLSAGGELVPLLDDFDAAYDFVGNDGATFYFATDRDAPRGRVVAVDLGRPDPRHWREVIAQGDDAIEEVRLVGGRLVVVTLHHASHRITVHDLHGGAAHPVPLPELGSVEAVTGRPDDREFFFSFTSFTRPSAVHRHDLAAERTTLLADVQAAAAQELVTEQVFVPSADGTRIPVFLVRRTDVTPGATPEECPPALLYGYGGFGIAMTPAFREAWLVWAELGGVLAVAGLRGGGEYGQEWHDAGRGASKQNVFDDAVAVAQWLVETGWTSSRRLAITGGSNGGLLAGACITQRPDLFAAAVIEVGVLDMLRFHRFTIGWAWASDYGCADNADDFATLIAYSPLHNLRPGTAYPATLVTTGDHDDRVVPGHSFKFAAALQAATNGDAPALIRIETDAGHGAGKPTSKRIAERADVVAFLVHTLDARR